MKKYKFLIFNILKKKKICRFSIIMFMLMMIIFLSILGIKNSMLQKYENIKLQNIDHNYILLKSSNKSYYQMIDEIKDIKFVEKYYPVMYAKIDNNYFIYDDCENLSILEGKCVSSKNEVLVSFNQENISDKISLTLNEKEIDLNVVGKYDWKTFSFSDEIKNPIIISKELLDSLDVEYTNEVVVKINDYENREKFLHLLAEIGGYNTSVQGKNEEILDRYRAYYNIINFLSKILVIFCSTIIFIVNIIIIYDNKQDIAIMRSVGYSNLKISLLMSIYVFLILLLSLVPGIVISILISLILKNLILLQISMVIKFIIVCLIGLLEANFLLIFLIKKINIIKLLYD